MPAILRRRKLISIKPERKNAVTYHKEEVQAEVMTPPPAADQQKIPGSTVVCPACKREVNKAEVEKNKYVCYECGSYFRVRTKNRIRMVADAGTFEPWFEYLESEITDELAGYSFSGINLNWDDLNDMDKPDAINCVQYFMLLTQKYGPVDVSDKVYDFVDDGVYVLDMIKLKSGVRKNFVALHQYEVEMPESRQKESIIQKKWTKRLMHYAVPDKLREETDPITEWIIKKNDRKLIKYAIKQKYIGKENAGKLLEYAFSLKNVETDDWIIELLTEEMTGHKQQSVEKSVKTQ